MNSKRIKMTLVLFFLIASTCTVLWLVRSPAVQGHAAAVTQVEAMAIDPFTSLNQKAKATTSSEPNAVRGLTEEVFKTFALSEVPVFTQESMKERVGRAEVNYRQGTHNGIPEVYVAKTVNTLWTRFALPDYVKVTPTMVRTVRVSLMVQLPNLIAHDDPGNKKREERVSINPFMSPLEATAVTMFLLQQKILNESFQSSHKEFYAALHKKQMQDWETWRAQKDGTAQVGQAEQPPDQTMRIVSNSKADSARRAAKRAAEAMSPDALLNVADSSLDILGIAR